MFRNIAVQLIGRDLSLGSVLHRAGADVDRYGDKVERSNTRQVRSWKQNVAAISLAVVAVSAITTGFNATVGAAAGFEQRMRNVNSITHTTERGLASLGASTLALSTRLPQSANDLAEGLYDIASSGFQGAEGLRVLEASAQAASAGLTTTANSGKAITAVLNAYGLGAEQANNVSDSLFQTVNLGVVNFEELTSVIGDVVGTAAAASVDINQVGAAVATMTLSGISASEAGTSLNRVLQSLLQPSEALASVYAQLGIESGAQALKADGLRGVMEKLRTATGGNVTALLALFPEIRAARGALALMSDEGRNYTKVAAEIEDADKRQGATKRALDEQLKATSAQWRLFTNRAQAAAIVGGTKLLPVVLDLMHGVENLAGQAVPLLNEGLAELSPFFRAVHDIGVDVVSVLTAIAIAAAPTAGVLLQLGSAAIIGGLNTLSGALAQLTGFAADHKEIVIILAAAYAATLLPSLAAAQVAFNRLILTPVVLGLVSMAGAAGTAAGGITGLTAAMAGLITVQAVATAGFAAVFAVLGLASYSWIKAGQAADQFVDQTTAGFDALDAATAQPVLDELRRTAEEAAAYGQQFDGIGGQFRAGWSSIFGDTDDIARKGQAAADSLNALSLQVQNAQENLTYLSAATGLTSEELAKLAIANDVDLSEPFVHAGQARQRVIDLTKDLERQTGVSTRVMASQVGLDIEAMQALAEEITKVGDRVQSSFFADTDIIANFKPEEATNALTAATKGLSKAQRDLHDLQARQAGKKKLDIGDEQSLANARQKVADATQAVTDAQGKVNSSTFAATYRRQVREASQFADQLQAAARKGLDPQLIARLLEAGPEQAAPVLQAIVADHSGRLVELANKSEAKLREISGRVVEFSRLTTLATSAATDQMVRDLGTAMAIASAQMASGGKATAEQIAKAIGKPSREVIRVAEEFGITIANAVQRGINSQKPTVGVGFQPLQGPGRPGAAAGGLITGPYLGPTADNVLIRANPREYVHQVAAVDYYGTSVMDAINRRLIPKALFDRLPGHASGGHPGRATGTATIVRIPMTEQRTHSAPVYVDKVIAHDYDDFREQLDRESDQSSSPGWLGAGR